MDGCVRRGVDGWMCIGNAGQIIFLIHAGVDSRDQTVARDPILDGFSFCPGLEGSVQKAKFIILEVDTQNFDDGVTGF